MSKPLDGVHVIEIAQEIAGPAAGLFLPISAPMWLSSGTRIRGTPAAGYFPSQSRGRT